MFSIKPKTNIAAVELKIKNLANVERQAIRKAFYDVGKDLVASAKEEINKTPKTGRQYRKYYGQKGRMKRPGYYTASAPGEAPAAVTGKLRKSINFTVSGSSEMTFGVDLSRADASYAKYLEYANLVSMTGRGSKNIAPRPFLSAAYKNNKGNIERKFSQAISQAMKK
jgi:type II secretory pathway pseudopilin PulG